jgi:glycosyltransferase involved in cell wall biosynthesis
MKKLAIITTHPIQYYAPIFKLLAERRKVCIKVFYTWGEAAQYRYDPGFGKSIIWDVPLLDGYDYQWVKNISKDPGSHHFNGIINPDINDQIEAFAPDALLVFGWAYQGHLKALRYFKGKMPVLFRGDSVVLVKHNVIKTALRYIRLRWVYRFIDHAFYVGTNNKNYFLKYGLKESQLSFAPHAIDNKRFENQRADEVAILKKQLEIGESDVVILFAGKLEKVKAPVSLLEAFLKLNQQGTHLLFAGDGNLEAQLRAIAKGAGNIHFLGFKNQTEMPVIYQACDLFCLPSISETWGLAVNEAMACGKAKLVSDKVGCAIDLVIPGENGNIFKSEDADDLLRSLTQLVKSKELLKAYGEKSQAIIASYNFEQIASAIENHINEKI